jgi:GNAT superfamily N-acetyltransferase
MTLQEGTVEPPGGATQAPSAVAVRKIVPAEIEALTDCVTRAFDDDPVMNFVVKHDERRLERIRVICRMFLTKLCLPHGEVYTTDALEGGAFWVPPGKYRTDILANLRLVPDMIRAAGIGRLPLVVSVLDAAEKKHPHEPHFYLPLLGVEPASQGRGIGTALMQPVLERCDREGIPAYLESSKERNVPLYERNGFRVTEVLELPKGGPPLWLMWRDPQ